MSSKKPKKHANRRLFSQDADSLQEVSDEFAVSRERIRQIEQTAMEKLLKELKRRGLKKEDFF